MNGFILIFSFIFQWGEIGFQKEILRISSRQVHHFFVYLDMIASLEYGGLRENVIEMFYSNTTHLKFWNTTSIGNPVRSLP